MNVNVLEFLVKVGDDGHQFVITGVPEDERLTVYLFDTTETVSVRQYVQPDLKLPKLEFKPIDTQDAKKRELLTNLNPLLPTHESNYYNILQQIKFKYLPYITKFKQIEKANQDTGNQFQSLDLIMKRITLSYQGTKGKKIEIFKKCRESLDKCQVYVKKFDEGVENLKKIELHPAQQNENQKFLIDIYYKTEAMEKWRNQCVQNSQNLKLKLDKTNAQIKNLKTKLKDQRNNNVQIMANYKPYSNTFQQLLDVKNQLVPIITTAIDEYSKLRSHILTYVDNPEDDQSLFFLSQFEFTPERQKQIDECLSQIVEQTEKVSKLLESLTKTRQIVQAQIVGFFKIMNQYGTEFDQVNEKLLQFIDDSDKMDKDFSYLLNPTQLPNAYKQALQEVSRRNELKQYLERKIKFLNQLCEQEKEKRSKFLIHYGRILPNDFIPHLKSAPPTFMVSKFDNDLPDITGLHSESDSVRFFEQEKLDTLQKEYDDLQALLKQTQQALGDNQPKGMKELLAATAKNSLKIFMNRHENALKPKDMNVSDQKAELALLENKHTQLENKHLQLENKLKIAANQQQKDQAEIQQLKERIQKDQKAMNDVTNACSNSKQEVEKLKTRIKYLENDLANKQLELDKVLLSHNTTKESYQSKNQEVDQIKLLLDNQSNQLTKVKEDLNRQVNKCENFEIQLVQKNNEINQLKVALQNSNKEKQTINDQITQLRQQVGDSTKRMKAIEQNMKCLEDEKSYLKLQSEKYKTQYDQLWSENNNLKVEISKLREAQQGKNFEEVQQLIVSKESLIDQMKQQIDELKEQLEEAKEAQEDKDEEIEQLEKEVSDLKLMNEQILIETHFQQAKIAELSDAQEDQKIQNLLDQKVDESVVKRLEEEVAQHQQRLIQIQDERDKHKQEAEELQAQVHYLQTKNEPINQLQMIQSKLSLLDEKFIFDLSSVKVGKNSIFLPMNGQLVPLTLKNISTLNLQTNEQAIDTEQKLILDQQCLSQSQRELLSDCGLILIAEVKSINNCEGLVQVDAPKYMIGFEENDSKLKNFYV